MSSDYEHSIDFQTLMLRHTQELTVFSSDALNISKMLQKKKTANRIWTLFWTEKRRIIIRQHILIDHQHFRSEFENGHSLCKTIFIENEVEWDNFLALFIDKGYTSMIPLFSDPEEYFHFKLHLIHRMTKNIATNNERFTNQMLNVYFLTRVFSSFFLERIRIFIPNRFGGRCILFWIRIVGCDIKLK